MQKFNKSYLSECGLHFFSPGIESNEIDQTTLNRILETLPKEINSNQDANEYNRLAKLLAKENKQGFKIALQELKDIQREKGAYQKIKKETSSIPADTKVGKLGSIFSLIAGSLAILAAPGAPTKESTVARDDYLYEKQLLKREEAIEDKLKQFRKSIPFIHPLWYARTAEEQSSIDKDLPENVTNLLSIVYAGKHYPPRNHKLRSTSWYFGISHSGMYVAISNWYDFRVFESKDEMADAIRFWRAQDIPLAQIRNNHDSNYKIDKDYLMSIVTGESNSRTILKLKSTQKKENRLLTFYSSAEGFIWSERTEGIYNTFSKPRYQISKNPPLFFSSISRYLSKKKQYVFCTESDAELYKILCKRINIT